MLVLSEDLIKFEFYSYFSSSCGHYTSYAYNSGTWLHFNDHTVKEVPISTVVDCKPYILFYTRRDMHKSTSPSSTSSS